VRAESPCRRSRHFGNEEKQIILPAIEAARARQIDASGPYPADTIFHRALRFEFDLVIAMYHDQALIPSRHSTSTTA